MTLRVPVSAGELIDKITILQIKLARIADPAKLENVRREHDALVAVRDAAIAPDAALADLTQRLRETNEALWEIEDQIRDHERAEDFGAAFIALARSVYRRNDVRAQLKREINVHLKSALVEEKSYASY